MRKAVPTTARTHERLCKMTLILSFLLLLGGCKNRPLSDNEKFNPREIHQDLVFHFDKINVDGVEYLILEKDNNHPHEGFGFMAFRGNRIIEKQDSIIAYLRTVLDLQTRLMTQVYRVELSRAQSITTEALNKHLSEVSGEMETVRRSKFSNEGETRDQQ